MTRPPFSEILPGLLYLGRARKAQRLRAAGIKAIVNASDRRYDGRRRHLPLAEGFNDPRMLLAVVKSLERRLALAGYGRVSRHRGCRFGQPMLLLR